MSTKRKNKKITLSKSSPTLNNILPRKYTVDNEQFFPTFDQAAEIACERNLPGCCCCNSATGRDMCPEWSQSEIVQLSTLDLKLAGLVSFLCLTYLLGALVVAGVVREKLKNYKTDYI